VLAILFRFGQSALVSDTEPTDWEERYERSVADEHQQRGPDDDWLSNPAFRMLVGSAFWAAGSAFYLVAEGLSWVGGLSLVLGSTGVWIAAHLLRSER
jgi:hypothetical protein